MSAATATPAKKEEKTGLLATVANNARQYGIVGALLVIVVAFEVLTGGVLLKPNSFVSLIQQNAYVIILAIGMVMVIIATHIDLSVGSLVAFIGGVCALLMERAGVNWMLAIVIGSGRRPDRRRLAGLLGRRHRHPGLHYHSGRHVDLPWSRHRDRRRIRADYLPRIPWHCP